MENFETLHQYLAAHSDEIGERILSSYPALFGAEESPSPLLSQMLRSPYPASPDHGDHGCKQTLAVGAQCERGGGVSCRQDAHRAGQHVGAQRETAVHRPGDGAAPSGREMGARGFSYPAPCPGVPYR